MNSRTGHNRDFSVPMANEATNAFRRYEMHILADNRTFSGRQSRARHGITTSIPRPKTAGNRLDRLYGKADFAYRTDTGIYRCVLQGKHYLMIKNRGRHLGTLPLRGQRGRHIPNEIEINDWQGVPNHNVGA